MLSIICVGNTWLTRTIFIGTFFRYDARGTLFDLKSFETPPGGYDRSEGLTGEEKRIEQLCDEERYFALYKGSRLLPEVI